MNGITTILENPVGIEPTFVGLQPTALATQPWTQTGGGTEESNLKPRRVCLQVRSLALTLSLFPVYNWCTRVDSNNGPSDFQTDALPTELQVQNLDPQAGLEPATFEIVIQSSKSN